MTEKDDMGTTTLVVEYTYDVFNRRIAKAVDTTSPFSMADAVIESYVYDDANGVTSVDGGNVVLDFVDPDGTGSATNDLERRQLFGNAVDQILAQENVDETITAADRVVWHLGDNLGTVRDLAKNDGALGEHYKYDSYGNVVSGDTSVTRYLFTSREYDADTGLQYNRARHYDAAVGRWISEDPLGFAAGDTNLARYVENSSTNLTDPSGLSPIITEIGGEIIRVIVEGKVFTGPDAVKDALIHLGRVNWREALEFSKMVRARDLAAQAAQAAQEAANSQLKRVTNIRTTLVGGGASVAAAEATVSLGMVGVTVGLIGRVLGAAESIATIPQRRAAITNNAIIVAPVYDATIDEAAAREAYEAASIHIVP